MKPLFEQEGEHIDCRFDNVRVPRDALLDRFGSVEADGSYRYGGLQHVRTLRMEKSSKTRLSHCSYLLKTIQFTIQLPMCYQYITCHCWDAFRQFFDSL